MKFIQFERKLMKLIYKIQAYKSKIKFCSIKFKTKMEQFHNELKPILPKLKNNFWKNIKMTPSFSLTKFSCRKNNWKKNKSVEMN